MTKKETELRKSLTYFQANLDRELSYSKDLQNEKEIEHFSKWIMECKRKIAEELAAKAAVKTIHGYRSNKAIMEFVTAEAREKVAVSEIRSEYKGGTTTKAVELLEIRYPNIEERTNTYIDAGLVGCYLASIA